MKVFYTDGSSGANGLKAGGWAFIEVDDGKVVLEKYDADFSSDVTNNKMELRAAIEASKYVSIGESAIINSDSQYVVKGISDWVWSWQKNNWKTAKKENVLNKELWQEFLEAIKGKQIQWVWARGHANDEFNHRVDKLAQKCYVDPNKIPFIKPAADKKSQISLKPEVGSLIYFNDTSKKYAVILNDVRVNNSLGFLARLLANSFGHEMDFFPYEGDKFFIVDNKSEKESQLTYKTFEQFKNNVSGQFHKFESKCNHHLIKDGDSLKCSICNKNFGWWCPDSKDHACHYHSENGEVLLNNGLTVKVPKNHNEQYETYDSCIFCGSPEERK